MFKSLRLSDTELGVGQPDLITTALGHHVFETDGLLVLENLFTEGFVDTLRGALANRYLKDAAESRIDLVRIGDRRYMFGVELEAPFNDPSLYASGLVLPLLRALLGHDFVLTSFGGVVALPGSEDQHVHRDHPSLFGDTEIDTLLPSYMVQLLLPLVEFNEEHGSTRVWPRSHRVTSAEARQLDPVDLRVSPGSCILTDYRLLHGGTANRSNRQRPALYLAYCRPWFRDYVNFRKHRALSIRGAELERVPEDYRGWFSGSETPAEG